MDLLILGCGYLGGRVADRWLAQGKTVAALTRSRAEALAARGIAPIIGDVTRPESLAALPPARTVLHAVGFDRTAGHSQRDVYVGGLSNILNAVQCERFIHISSTGVYGQTDGEWVNEDSPTVPMESSGQVVFEAEQLLKATLPTAVILRFAGIYGPNRLLRRAALLAGEPLVGDAEKYLNLIHVADGVAAVVQAELHAAPGAVFNVSDGHPPTRRQFYTHLAQLLGAPPAKFESPPVAKLEPNRRVSNRKAHDNIDFLPRYGSYIEGLAGSM